MTSLFEPLVFRSGLVAPNRLALAPLTNLQSHDDGSLGEDELKWLVSRARGGFGLVMTCASHVARDGQAWKGELGCFDDRLLPGLTRLASALREAGAKSVVQLFHGGLRAEPKLTGAQPWSAVEGHGARAGTRDDLFRVIEQFATAAVRAKISGFDGVEVHGAHGYLLTQFLSAENQRTDGWGGSFSNRARLLREVVRTVRTRVGLEFTVGVRLSPEDFGNAKGLDLDESLQLAGWLAKDGVDYVHLSLWHSELNTRKRPEQHAVTLFRAALPPEVRLVVAGNVWDRSQAEALLARGADGVAIGRAAITNQAWPRGIQDPAWVSRRLPISEQALLEAEVSPRFVEYLKLRQGFVAP